MYTPNQDKNSPDPISNYFFYLLNGIKPCTHFIDPKCKQIGKANVKNHPQ